MTKPAVWIGFSAFTALLCTSCAVHRQSTDAMQVLPPDERHAFARPDPQWAREIQWLKPLYDDVTLTSYTMLTQDPHQPAYPHEELYFAAGSSREIDAARKRLRVQPDGRVTLEIDRDGPRMWMRTFGADGSISSYRFYPAANTLQAAVSTRPDGGLTSTLTGGTGHFLDWSGGGRTVQHNVVRHGAILLSAEFNGPECTGLGLMAHTGDSLSRTPSGERLNLISRAEFWRLDGDRVTAYVTTITDAELAKRVLPPDDLHRKLERESVRTNFTSRVPATQPAPYEPTVADYLTRRAELLQNFVGDLKAAGETWESLHLQRLHDDPRAPLPVPDPAWRADNNH